MRNQRPMKSNRDVALWRMSCSSTGSWRPWAFRRVCSTSGTNSIQGIGLTYDFAHLVSKWYPAESHENLRLLHEQIVASASPDHHKHSALYYILKDLQKNSHQSPRDFANASYLPGKYRTFIDGIWYLDRLEFEVCVRYFSVVISLTLVIPKESFRLSHRACTDPYIPRRNIIHSMSACSRCYSSRCLLPDRHAYYYIGQGRRNLFSHPLSRQCHGSILLLTDTGRYEPPCSLREADKLRSCKLAWSNQSNKRCRVDQPTFERRRRVLVYRVLGRWKGEELGWCEWYLDHASNRNRTFRVCSTRP